MNKKKKLEKLEKKFNKNLDKYEETLDIKYPLKNDKLQRKMDKLNLSKEQKKEAKKYRKAIFKAIKIGDLSDVEAYVKEVKLVINDDKYDVENHKILLKGAIADGLRNRYLDKDAIYEMKFLIDENNLDIDIDECLNEAKIKYNLREAFKNVDSGEELAKNIQGRLFYNDWMEIINCYRKNWSRKKILEFLRYLAYDDAADALEKKDYSWLIEKLEEDQYM